MVQRKHFCPTWPENPPLQLLPVPLSLSFSATWFPAPCTSGMPWGSWSLLPIKLERQRFRNLIFRRMSCSILNKWSSSTSGMVSLIQLANFRTYSTLWPALPRLWRTWKRWKNREFENQIIFRLFLLDKVGFSAFLTFTSWKKGGIFRNTSQPWFHETLILFYLNRVSFSRKKDNYLISRNHIISNHLRAIPRFLQMRGNF